MPNFNYMLVFIISFVKQQIFQNNSNGFLFDMENYDSIKKDFLINLLELSSNSIKFF